MTPSDFTAAHTLANKLIATCQPPEFWDVLEGLTAGQCAALDTIAFECQTCNHWFPVADRREGKNGQWYCRGCI